MFTTQSLSSSQCLFWDNCVLINAHEDAEFVGHRMSEEHCIIYHPRGRRGGAGCWVAFR